MSTNDQLGERTGTLAERPDANSQRAGSFWTTLPDKTVYQVIRDPVTGAQTWEAVAGPGAGGVPSTLAVTTDDALLVNGSHSTTLASALAFAALASSATQRGTMSIADFQKLAQFLAESNYFRLDASRAIQGNLDLGGHRIVDGAAAVDPTDFVILSQLTMAAAGFRAMPGGPVRVASTADDGNIVLAGSPTIRGVTVNPGDPLHSVLITANTIPSENGLWDVQAGAWTRRSDSPSGGSLTHGAYVLALEGTPDSAGKGGAGAAWALSDDVAVIDTDPQTWVEVLVSPTFTASNGVQLVGFDIQGKADPEGSIVAGAGGLKVGVLANDAEHGDLGGGSLHAIVTNLLAGFMSPAMLAQLNALAGSGAGSLEHFSGTVTGTGAPLIPGTAVYLGPQSATPSVLVFPVPDGTYVKGLQIFVPSNSFGVPGSGANVDVVQAGPTAGGPLTPVFGGSIAPNQTGLIPVPPQASALLPNGSSYGVRVTPFGTGTLSLAVTVILGPTP